VTNPSETRKTYEKYQRELADLLSKKALLDRTIIAVRQTLQGLAALCEAENIEIDASPEAEYLLETSALPDEILSVLRARHPGYHRATIIKQQLEKLGHDMSKYKNPLATIHMVLKRLIEADKVETGTNEAGEKLYRAKSWLYSGFQEVERVIRVRELNQKK